MPLAVLKTAWLLPFFVTVTLAQQYYEVEVQADAPENVFEQVQICDLNHHIVTHFRCCSATMPWRKSRTSKHNSRT